MSSTKTKVDLRGLPVALVAVDLCIFKIINDSLYVYVNKVQNELYKDLECLPGALISADEEAEKTLYRILKDKTSLQKKDIYFEQLYTFSDVARDKRSRVVSIAHMCLYSGDVMTGFVKVDNLRKLAYDHSSIIKYSLERLRSKIGYTTIVSKLVAPTFTYSELQRTYEVILNKTMDKRNFRKKIDSLHLLEETGNKKQEGKMRPAALYRFVNKEVKVISVFE